MLKELSLCHAGWRNDNYADNNGNNNGDGNENGYDKGTGHKECRDIAETVFKLHRIHFFLLNYDKQKTSLQKSRKVLSIIRILPLIYQSIITLCELAPCQKRFLTVAGLHWAHPSTSLDKSISTILNYYTEKTFQ